jgi:hypothetical protein
MNQTKVKLFEISVGVQFAAPPLQHAHHDRGFVAQNDVLKSALYTGLLNFLESWFDHMHDSRPA